MYTLEGIVCGTLWMGGFAAYFAEDQTFQTREELDEFIKTTQNSKDISHLDGGMGFQKIKAVCYEITHSFYQTINEREYLCKNSDESFYYEAEHLTDKEKDFFSEAIVKRELWKDLLH